MTRHAPASRLRWFPALAGGYGLTLLIWLSIEDAGALIPAALGWVGAWLIAFSRRGRLHGAAASASAGRGAALFSILRWAAIGGGAAVIAAALMLVRSGWHGHVVPDYPLAMIADMLARAPLWMVVGGLIGSGRAIGRRR